MLGKNEKQREISLDLLYYRYLKFHIFFFLFLVTKINEMLSFIITDNKYIKILYAH